MNGIKQVTIVDLTICDPDKNTYPELQNEIHEMWSDNELGNDTYYYRWNNKKDSERYPDIFKFLKDNMIQGDIMIHWWW